jgi:predicted DNA-binding protein with PD1-like motif
MSARVFPILEAVLTPTTNTALRRFDDELGLNVIYKA